eukprot:jgi/Botrbrau1/7815/Bobra.0159s0243.1
MSQPAVIRALPMFTKDGASKKINLIREIGIGLGLGISLGLVWQTWHWNEKKKIADWYKANAALRNES